MHPVRAQRTRPVFWSRLGLRAAQEVHPPLWASGYAPIKWGYKVPAPTDRLWNSEIKSRTLSTVWAVEGHRPQQVLLSPVGLSASLTAAALPPQIPKRPGHKVILLIRTKDVRSLPFLRCETSWEKRWSFGKIHFDTLPKTPMAITFLQRSKGSRHPCPQTGAFLGNGLQRTLPLRAITVLRRPHGCRRGTGGTQGTEHQHEPRRWRGRRWRGAHGTGGGLTAGL